MNTINIAGVDWDSYYKNGKSSLKKRLEEESGMWDNWTRSDKRYMLICHLIIVANDIDNNPSGRVTSHLDFCVNSDDIESLRLLWNSKFIQERYDTTMQHFIADMQEKKVIEFCSVGM